MSAPEFVKGKVIRVKFEEYLRVFEKLDGVRTWKVLGLPKKFRLLAMNINVKAGSVDFLIESEEYLAVSTNAQIPLVEIGFEQISKESDGQPSQIIT